MRGRVTGIGLLSVSIAVVSLAVTPAAAEQSATAVTMASAWEAVYDGPGARADTAVDVAVDSVTGLVAVLGTSAGADGDLDLSTVAYAGDGTLLWNARVAGPDGVDDSARAVAVDPARGRVYVAGSVVQSGSPRAVLVAYDRNGVELWRKLTGPGGRMGTWAAVAVDPATGSVVVAGTSTANSYAEGQAVTQVVDPAGRTRWSRTYDGVPGRDTVTDMALDAVGGTVYITGYSDEPDGWLIGFTAAYSTRGALRWSAQVDTPGRSDVVNWSLASAPDGSGVYVGSRVALTSRLTAYGSTGLVRWQKTLNSPYQGGRAALSDVVVHPVTGEVTATASGITSDGADSVLMASAYRADGRSTWSVTTDAAGDLFPTEATVDVVSGRVFIATTQTDDVVPGKKNALVYAFAGGVEDATFARTVGHGASGNGVALDPRTGVVYVAGSDLPATFGAPGDYLTLALSSLW